METYNKMLFDDSSDESFGLWGKLLNGLLDSDDCSEGDVFQLFFGVLVRNKYNIISIQNDPVALLFW